MTHGLSRIIWIDQGGPESQVIPMTPIIPDKWLVGSRSMSGLRPSIPGIPLISIKVLIGPERQRSRPGLPRGRTK